MAEITLVYSYKEDFEQVLRRPIETAVVIGMWPKPPEVKNRHSKKRTSPDSALRIAIPSLLKNPAGHDA
jgi:hypothetical protein